MSTPSQLITKARRQTHSNSFSYTDDDALLDLNNRYQTIIWRIQTEVDEGHYWDWLTDDTVTSQSEYTIDSFGDIKINQIDKVAVKYFTTDTKYTILTKVDHNTLDYDFASYSDWAGQPFYFIKDESVFIAPSPSEIVTAWIKIYIIYQPADVTISSTEADLEIAPRFHQFLVDWMCADYWYANGKEDKWQFYDTKFTNWVTWMLKAMKNRAQEPVEYVVSTNPYE